MTNEEIFSKLLEIFSTSLSHVDTSAVTMESDLFTDLGMDSLSLLLSSLAIENTFGIRIASGARFSKVRDVVDYIARETTPS